MADKKWLIIVNPNAGAGKCGKDWPEIESILKKEGIQYNLEITLRRFHAMVIARKRVLEGIRKIIVVGGDGTLNEVINGIFSQSLVPTHEIMLGMIPVGTGNDWARMFNISSDYLEAIKIIKEENTFIQDAGKVSFMNNDRQFKRYFINIAGIGFDAMVTSKSNRLKENGKSNPLMYFWNIFLGLFSYKFFNATINIDGVDSTYNIFSMNVGICKYSGGGMMQVPAAIPDDGIFDLTIIRKIGKLGVLKSLPMLYNGTINKHPKVSSLNGKNIRIESAKHVYLETDGESLGHTPMEFDIIPASVKVITGKQSA
jgi:YegS/Rv2252/BmrU family lipid kinase